MCVLSSIVGISSLSPPLSKHASCAFGSKHANLLGSSEVVASWERPALWPTKFWACRLHSNRCSTIGPDRRPSQDGGQTRRKAILKSWVCSTWWSLWRWGRWHVENTRPMWPCQAIPTKSRCRASMHCKATNVKRWWSRTYWLHMITSHHPIRMCGVKGVLCCCLALSALVISSRAFLAAPERASSWVLPRIDIKLDAGNTCCMRYNVGPLLVNTGSGFW